MHPNRGKRFSTLVILSFFFLGGCDLFNTVPDGKADITDAGLSVVADAGSDTSSETDAGLGTLPPIHFAFTVHLEGHALLSDEAVTRYFDNIQAYADLALAHGVPVTWEVRNILEHLEAGTEHLLITLRDEGHGIGFHADSGDISMTQAEFELDLQGGRDALLDLGITAYHVSGICSEKDWVTAASSAGFKAVNGIVDYCLKSLPDADQPAHVRDCTNPADCHDPYASEPSEALFPWKAEDGSNWTAPQEEGLLLIPSSGTITCAAESAASPESSPTHCEFLDNDVTAVLNYIDDALTYREIDKFHQLTFVWSYGSSIPMGRFKSLLEGIQTRTETGELYPVTTPKMMLKYEQFLGNRPAD
jgi:hypothetical protein